MRRVVLFASVVVAVVLVVLFSWAFQRRLIYLPSTGAVPSAATTLPGARDVQLTTNDGLQLGAWYIPAGRPAGAFTVLVANGNAGDRSLRAPLARELANQGFGVLLFDYRGYGANPGSPSEEGLSRDVRAARQFLLEEGVPGNHLLYYGESLGAAVVAELATEHPPAGLVLRSPFTDLDGRTDSLPVSARTCVAEGPFPGIQVPSSRRRTNHCRVRHSRLRRSPRRKPTVGLRCPWPDTPRRRGGR
jgi:uncharacterized protein